MVPFDRYSAVLDACVMFPMIVRDVLLTLASHEFYSPKWSPRIRDEWTRNLLSRLEQRTPKHLSNMLRGLLVPQTEPFPMPALQSTWRKMHAWHPSMTKIAMW